jgi:hypothetical protein
LPRFDKLSEALKGQADFQAVLAVFYCDILDFHRRAYKFFRASAWKRFFDSSWGRFDIRFKGVIDSLKYHAKLVDREANACNIASVQEWRERYLDDLRVREKRRSEDQFEKVLNWIDAKGTDDLFDGLLAKCYGDSCDWLIDHEKFKDWRAKGTQNRMLWLNGKPGSGKSVLFARTIEHMRFSKRHTLAYFVCDFRSVDLITCSNILKSIARQLITQNPDLAGLVYDDYIMQGLTPSKKHLKDIIMAGLSAATSVRIMIDGLDECPVDDQKEVIAALRDFTSKGPTTVDCKAAFFSRDLDYIRKALKKSTMVSLKDQSPAITSAIQAFVRHKMDEIKDERDDGSDDDQFFDTITSRIIAKADGKHKTAVFEIQHMLILGQGMFLWVQLMLSMLNGLDSRFDIEQAVDSLPTGLHEAYVFSKNL